MKTKLVDVASIAAESSSNKGAAETGPFEIKFECFSLPRIDLGKLKNFYIAPRKRTSKSDIIFDRTFFAESPYQTLEFGPL